MPYEQAEAYQDTDSHPEQRLRALGAAEQLFWLLDHTHPTHFVMAAEIEGSTTADAWRSALLDVQRRHPLLSARISGNSDSPLCFYKTVNARIPLRVVEGALPSWQNEVAKELATPFDFATAPLMRAVLVRNDKGATLILASHHSVADGMGAAYVIADILRSLAGEKLTPLDLIHPMEHLLERELYQLRPSPAPLGTVISKAYRVPDAMPPNVTTLALTADLTAALVKRSRDERTTVHGALAAAIHEAGRRLNSDWRARPVRTFTPINIRDLAKQVETAMGVYVSFAVTSDERQLGAPIWNAARVMNENIAQSRTREAMLMHLRDMRDMAASRPNFEAIAEFASASLAFDLLLTNLGNEPVATDYGSIKLRALWGPMVRSGLTGEQVIGVCTSNGVLRLVHTSYTPLPNFLDIVSNILEEAVFARAG